MEWPAPQTAGGAREAGGASRAGKGSHLHYDQQVLIALPQEIHDDAFEIPTTPARQICESPLLDAPR